MGRRAEVSVEAIKTLILSNRTVVQRQRTEFSSSRLVICSTVSYAAAQLEIGCEIFHNQLWER